MIICWSFSSQGANLLFNAGYNEVNYRNKSKSQILSDIENVWQENVKLEYDYDVSRGKKHLSTLSGGLDSRLLVMTADDLGFSENDNLCFSQKGYLDEVIAEKVANHLNQKFLFIDLSGGSYLSDIEENTCLNEGLVFYSGSGHLNSALKTIKSNEYSLLHTGLIGDGLLGGFVSDKKVIKASSLSNRLSTRFYDKISTDLDLYVQKFSNEETYKLQNRGLNVAICAAWVSEAHGVPLSAPFLHKDFIDLCLSIPPELKWNQNIYIDWVNKYHKNTTQFRWERTKLKPNAKWKTEAGRYIEHALKYGGKLLPKLKAYNMNPYDVWLKDKSLSDSLKCYFEKALSTQHMSTEIKRDLHSMFYTGTSIEKILSLTVAAAIIMLYDE